mmetsp:Transcript_18408/g.41932  ORF Transcript_18408/g.41932 Transcript_18408/m.41932 type:complete len:395 (-) Transcript_18408:114-1298(-)
MLSRSSASLCSCIVILSIDSLVFAISTSFFLNLSTSFSLSFSSILVLCCTASSSSLRLLISVSFFFNSSPPSWLVESSSASLSCSSNTLVLCILRFSLSAFTCSSAESFSASSSTILPSSSAIVSLTSDGCLPPSLLELCCFIIFTTWSRSDCTQFCRTLSASLPIAGSSTESLSASSSDIVTFAFPRIVGAPPTALTSSSVMNVPELKSSLWCAWSSPQSAAFPLSFLAATSLFTIPPTSTSGEPEESPRSLLASLSVCSRIALSSCRFCFSSAMFQFDISSLPAFADSRLSSGVLALTLGGMLVDFFHVVVQISSFLPLSSGQDLRALCHKTAYIRPGMKFQPTIALQNSSAAPPNAKSPPSNHETPSPPPPTISACSLSSRGVGSVLSRSL